MRITGDWEVSADVGAATPDAAALAAAELGAAFACDTAFALAAVLTLPGSGFGMGCLDEKYV